MSTPKRERPWIADDELNGLEHGWWEGNAELVARFWEMDRSISSLLRAHYLSDIRSFFLDGRKSSRVLELGCGSGWVGQAIAGNGIAILGTDFSQAQLTLAKDNAERLGLSSATQYTLATSADWPEETAACDSVLIHSFLHHLDGHELESFLDELAARTAPGTRIAIFEPAFYEAEMPTTSSHFGKIAHRLATRVAERINRDIIALNDADERRRAAFVKLFETADSKGWYLSPKEVPFGQEAFTADLSKRFKIVSNNWAIVYTVGWAFERNLLRHTPATEHRLWPILTLLDRLLAKDTKFLKQRLRKPAHAFHIWKCVKL